jgi:2-phospho-L-lactate guanylyltransferase
MRFIIPFEGREPKTRLGDTLSLTERQAFARAMLRDVLIAVRDAGHDPVIVSPSPLDIETPTIVDDSPLSEAINSTLSTAVLPVAVVMADLPLVTPSTLGQFLETPGDVVLAPGIGGGTNALVVRDSAFSVDYHGTSYLDHLDIAQEAGLTVSEAGPWRLAVDVDEPSDLTEILLHSDGHAHEWLVEHGFSLETTSGRTNTTRARRTSSLPGGPSG